MRIEYEEEDPYNPGYYYFQDVLGYTFTNGGSQPIDWYYVASGIYYQRPDQSIHLGDTSVVLTSGDDVQFVNVAVDDGTPVSLESGPNVLLEGVSYRANVNVSCGGERFKVVVKFQLPQYSSTCCNAVNSRVNVFSTSKFELTEHPVYGYRYRFFPDTSPPAAPDTTPPLAVAFVRRKADGSGSSNTLRVLVGGSYQGGQSYSTPANLHLNCN